MALKSYEKDPEAVLDYALDWAAKGWLAAGETITTSTWTVPAGLTKVSESNTVSLATVWISGGTAGTDYTVTNHIKTNMDREDDRSFIIAVRNR